MTVARNTLIDQTSIGTYHITSRCVRRAFLCGDQYEHRRQWLEDMVRRFSRCFCIDVLTFSFMSNHIHCILRNRPDKAEALSAYEVMDGWSQLFPLRNQQTNELIPWPVDQIRALAQDAELVAKRRSQLADISTFMKLLKQRIARRSNREDKVTGHFWEGRFACVALLDDAAVVSCMAYNDLNPIRARMAETPEASDHTGIQQRIANRQTHRCAQALLQENQRKPQLSPALVRQAQEAIRQGPEAGLWIAPIDEATNGRLTLDDYLELVDQTGRLIKDNKRGHIPHDLAAILERLDIDTTRWLTVMSQRNNFIGRAVGALAKLTDAAKRAAKHWLVDKTRIHRDRRRIHTT